MNTENENQKTEKLYKLISIAINARLNCIKSENEIWLEKWGDKISEYNNLLPDGSGFCNIQIDLEKSNNQKIVIDFTYYHYDENGFGLGWYDYQLVLNPDFMNGFTMKIKGKDINEIKDYFYNTFDYILNQEIERK